MTIDHEEEPYQLKINDCMGVMVSSHAKKIFAWLEFIIMKDMPITSCDDEIICKYFTYEKVRCVLYFNLIELMKYLDRL